jgi:hypothetical protein
MLFSPLITPPVGDVRELEQSLAGFTVNLIVTLVTDALPAGVSAGVNVPTPVWNLQLPLPTASGFADAIGGATNTAIETTIKRLLRQTIDFRIYRPPVHSCRSYRRLQRTRVLSIAGTLVLVKRI